MKITKELKFGKKSFSLIIVELTFWQSEMHLRDCKMGSLWGRSFTLPHLEITPRIVSRSPIPSWSLKTALAVQVQFHSTGFIILLNIKAHRHCFVLTHLPSFPVPRGVSSDLGLSLFHEPGMSAAAAVAAVVVGPRTTVRSSQKNVLLWLCSERLSFLTCELFF